MTDKEIVNINETELIKFNVTDKTISDLKEKYKDLTTQGPDGYAIVKAAIKDVSSIRINLEKFRVEKKAPLLAAEKYLDKEAKRITALLVEIEDPLKLMKKRVDDVEAQIKREREEKEAKRIADIEELIESLKFEPIPLIAYDTARLDSLRMDFMTKIGGINERYGEFADKAETVGRESIELIDKMHERAEQREAEKVELANQKAEQDAKDKKLADERAEFEEEKAEQQRIEKVRCTRAEYIDSIRQAAVKEYDDSNCIQDAIEILLDKDEATNGVDEEIRNAINSTINTLRKRALDMEKIEQFEIEKAEREETERQDEVKRKAKEQAEADAIEQRLQAIEDEKEKKLADERREQLRIENLSDAEFLFEYHGNLTELGFPTGIKNADLSDKIMAAFNVYAGTLLEAYEDLKEPIVIGVDMADPDTRDYSPGTE